MSRRTLLRLAAVNAGLVALPAGLAACSRSGLTVERRWADCRYFAVQQIDGRAAIVGWNERDLRPRVVADLGGGAVIGSQTCLTPTVALVGWVPEGDNTHFSVVEPRRSTVSTLRPVIDTGAFAVVGQTVQVLTPGQPATVVTYEANLESELARTTVDIANVVAIRGTSEGGLVLGTARDGEVLVAEILPRGTSAQVRRTGTKGTPVDVLRLGPRTVVSVLRDPALGDASNSGVVVLEAERATRHMQGWTRPGAMAVVSADRFALEDSRGTQRVVTVVDARSGKIVDEHGLGSRQTVLGLAAAAGGVMALQADRISLVGDKGVSSSREIDGLITDQW